MVKVLLGLGVVAVLAGLGMIGFGIPINEFGIGNTLISAGVTALIGGFVVLGLAAVVGELRRVAGLLGAQPQSQMARSGDQVEPAAGARGRPVSARAPVPPKPSVTAPARASRRPAEADPAAGEAGVSPEAPVERSRPYIVPSARSEPLIVEEAEGVTLSPEAVPRSAPYAPARRPGAAAPEPGFERNMFASMWEARPKPVAPEHEMTAPMPGETPPMPTSPNVSAPTKAKASISVGDAEPTPVSVLKSGVVDGMAYTLYSDGSIEAELPEGTVRFASIAELREHLEKNA